MSDETETLALEVTETVRYVAEVELTDDLLDEAHSRGHDRDWRGVLDMLAEDPDHDAVLAVIEDLGSFQGVESREVGAA